MDGKEVVLLPYKTASRTVPQSALGDAEPPPGSDASNGNQHSQKASLRVTSLTAAPGLCSCSSQKRPPLITHFCHFLQCLRPDLHPSPRDIDVI